MQKIINMLIVHVGVIRHVIIIYCNIHVHVMLVWYMRLAYTCKSLYAWQFIMYMQVFCIDRFSVLQYDCFIYNNVTRMRLLKISFQHMVLNELGHYLKAESIILFQSHNTHSCQVSRNDRASPRILLLAVSVVSWVTQKSTNVPEVL